MMRVREIGGEVWWIGFVVLLACCDSMIEGGERSLVKSADDSLRADVRHELFVRVEGDYYLVDEDGVDSVFVMSEVVSGVDSCDLDYGQEEIFRCWWIGWTYGLGYYPEWVEVRIGGVSVRWIDDNEEVMSFGEALDSAWGLWGAVWDTSAWIGNVVYSPELFRVDASVLYQGGNVIAMNGERVKVVSDWVGGGEKEIWMLDGGINRLFVQTVGAGNYEECYDWSQRWSKVSGFTYRFNGFDSVEMSLLFDNHLAGCHAGVDRAVIAGVAVDSVQREQMIYQDWNLIE